MGETWLLLFTKAPVLFKHVIYYVHLIEFKIFLIMQFGD